MQNQPEPLPFLPPAKPDGIEELPCDRWIASSALQKAIRRGDCITAQRAATNLFNHDKRAIWRRLLVIAFEDIGVGCPDALIEAASLASDPELRSVTGGDRAAVLHICSRLAGAPKDRSTDYLIAAAVFHPQLQELRDVLRRDGPGEAIRIVEDTSRSAQERAVAAWYATGFDFGFAQKQMD